MVIMASGFTPANTSKCDECLSDVRSAKATYRLEIQKNLCAECSFKHQGFIKGLAEKVTWTCKKHTDREAELFCVTHDYPICHVCAVTSNHTDCTRNDINDVRKEREKELAELICRVKARGNKLNQYTKEVQHHTFETAKYLRIIREQLFAAAEDEKTQIIKDRDQREERINADCDEQIRKLIEKRNERFKQAGDEAEKKLQKIRDEQYLLEEQINRVERGLQACKIKLMPGLDELATSIRDECMKAENLIIKQENLMTDFHDITRQMNEHLNVELSRKRLDKVKEEIEKIKFMRGTELLGRLEGLEERWVKVRDLSMEGAPMGFLGFISSNDVVIEDLKNCVTTARLGNITQYTTRFTLIPGFKPVCYNSLSDGGHVFGTTDGNLRVYDQYWNYARTIETKYLNPLKVTVDKDGLILAAENGGSSISVFSPDDGKCLHTIKLSKIMSIRDLKTMQTGDVIVLLDMRSQGSVVCTLDRSGVIKWKTHISRRSMMIEIAVDMTSDCVFLLYLDKERRVFVVREVLRSGREVSRCVTEWEWQLFSDSSPSFDVLPPDLLIVRNVTHFTIYKRLPPRIIGSLEELQELGH